MSTAAEHIAGWEAAGLIDQEMGDRLRAAEATQPESPAVTPPSVEDASVPASSRMFGPSVQVAEVFGYLGGGFVLAAWSAFMATTAAPADDPSLTIGILGLAAAAVLTGIAMRLRLGGARSSRAAGVVLLVALGYVSGAAIALVSGGSIAWPLAGVLVSTAVVLVAVVYRLLHPSALTQIGLLASLTALAGSLLVWLQVTIFPENVSDIMGAATSSGPDPILLVVASAAWWLLVASGMGLLGLAEARGAGRASDPTAASRAAVTRFWAGLLAVIGLSTSISRSAPSADGGYARVLEPLIGDIAVLILSAVLVERAFRRDATSYIYAAALGLIVALTDFNIAYLSNSTSAALLVEGLILIGVGIGADRLRRRIGQDRGTPTDDPPLADLPGPDDVVVPEPLAPAAEAT